MKFRPRLALAAVALSLLAACGGGSSQVDPFQPRRLIVFGDESSLVTPLGKRYAVNGLRLENGQQVPDCTTNPIWVQTVAASFNLVLAACNPANATVSSLQYAQLGARVADVRRQIDQHFSGGGLTRTDLITVMAGLHDILDLYSQFPAQSRTQLVAQAGERGRQLAAEANRLANANGRILVLTLPNVGNTPFAITERQNRNDVNRQELLKELSNAFNRELRLTLINDGRLIGLVLADELVDALVQFPFSAQLTNTSEGVCAVALPDCTTQTLVANGDPNGWLWADSLRLGTAAHSQMGQSAVSRAARNPF